MDWRGYAKCEDETSNILGFNDQKFAMLAQACYVSLCWGKRDYGSMLGEEGFSGHFPARAPHP